MHDQIPSTSSEKTAVKVSESILTPVAVPFASHSLSDQEPPGKKPRGRPKCSKSPEPLQATIGDDDKKRKVDHHHHDKIDFRRTSEVDAAAVGSSTQSMQQLISRFEEQYTEMGKRYHEMGDVLQQMKEVASGRERTEEEIRAELLEEVQRNILNSFQRK